jgi:hypothetical protein
MKNAVSKRRTTVRRWKKHKMNTEQPKEEEEEKNTRTERENVCEWICVVCVLSFLLTGDGVSMEVHNDRFQLELIGFQGVGVVQS